MSLSLSIVFLFLSFEGFEGDFPFPFSSLGVRLALSPTSKSSLPLSEFFEFVRRLCVPKVSSKSTLEVEDDAAELPPHGAASPGRRSARGAIQH